MDITVHTHVYVCPYSHMLCLYMYSWIFMDILTWFTQDIHGYFCTPGAINKSHVSQDTSPLGDALRALVLVFIKSIEQPKTGTYHGDVAW